jgi:hypothetical protein
MFEELLNPDFSKVEPPFAFPTAVYGDPMAQAAHHSLTASFLSPVCVQCCLTVALMGFSLVADVLAVFLCLVVYFSCICLAPLLINWVTYLFIKLQVFIIF